MDLLEIKLYFYNASSLILFKIKKKYSKFDILSLCLMWKLSDLWDLFVFRKRGKKGEKNGKGLRHFSMKVCEKVQKKGVTTYNEVADELVAEFSSSDNHMSPNDAVSAAVERHFLRMMQTLLTTNRNLWKWGILHGFFNIWNLVFPHLQHVYDQKNIRRRVYDALNVLMAMNIISKEKKEIKWIGLPTNSAQECQNLEVETHSDDCSVEQISPFTCVIILNHYFNCRWRGKGGWKGLSRNSHSFRSSYCRYEWMLVFMGGSLHVALVTPMLVLLEMRELWFSAFQ